jgi:protein-disulfide isomerase
MQTRLAGLVSVGVAAGLLGASVGASAAEAPEATRTGPPVAMVAGQAIYESDLLPSVQGQLLPLQNKEYEVKSRALENLIRQRLLEAEARKEGLTSEKLLEREADSHVAEPTDAEVEAYYLGQKDRLNRSLDDVKAQLRARLKQARIQQAREEYMARLREKAQVTILLDRPRVHVALDPKRVRGNPKAPVTIVEFSDFQCPYCHRIEPTLKQLLARYPDQVSLSFRDFPLRQIHPQAELAAEAARCAEEQGKFWEYHDALFAGSKLDRDGLVEEARTLKLDEGRFDACLTAGKYRSQIDKDVQDGRRAGISGTPGFFINGIPLSGAQPLDSFTRVIDEELARGGS